MPLILPTTVISFLYYPILILLYYLYILHRRHRRCNYPRLGWLRGLKNLVTERADDGCVLTFLDESEVQPA